MHDRGTGIHNLMGRQGVEALDILKQVEAALVNLACARDDEWMPEYEAWLDAQEEEQTR